jgi:hypothetical protein
LIITIVRSVIIAGIGEAVFIIRILFTDTIRGSIHRGIMIHGITIHGFIIPLITGLITVILIMDITAGVDLFTNLLIQVIMKPIAVRLLMV